ncbi:MAG: hypothetical protein ACXWKO_07190, partial [Phenylobacterium sp.]
GSGFLSANVMFPKDRIAVIAFTNNDWADPGVVAQRVAFAVLPPTPAEARARKVFDGFRAGLIDRSLFTDNANAFLTDAVLADQKAGLAAFGPARLFELKGESTRGGLRTRNWQVTTARGALSVVERAYPDGKLEQFMISKAD